MEFKPDEVPAFLNLFNEHKQLIRNFNGVKRLELLRDIDNPHIFFTYSWWNSSEDLENYRQSELFKKIWSQTKVLFSAKPQAWSLLQEYIA
jgi:hypothetical protein